MKLTLKVSLRISNPTFGKHSASFRASAQSRASCAEIADKNRIKGTAWPAIEGITE